MNNGALQLVPTSDDNLHLHHPYTNEQRSNYCNICRPLYISALNGDWETARKVIDIDGGYVRARITDGEETALHIAAAGKHVDFVKNLIDKMNPEDLEIKNGSGNTALCFAAAKTNVQIVQLMVKKHRLLPTIPDPTGVKPIYMSAVLGHRDIVDYLYPLSGVEEWPEEEQAHLLTTCIATSLFDVALKMITDHPQLVVVKDRDDETALDVLARLPSGFSGGNENATWTRFFKLLFAGMKQVQIGCSLRTQHSRLLECILEKVLRNDNLQISDVMTNAPRLMLDAAKRGNIEFLTMVINYFPDLLWTTDNSRRSIFHVAILHRHQSIFNLLYELDSFSHLTTFMDDNHNNMLHLAAKQPPENHLNTVSGAALQMQQEILWFKEVEKIVQPSYINKENRSGKTPQDIFTKEHQRLMRKGEDWMKGTATSSMLVATIIASVVFTSIFTTPGGINNNNGVTNMSNNAILKVFYVSEAISMFSSLASILMFLSILTSRYAEMDFHHTLPFRLMIGVVTLLISLVAMAVAFCLAIYLTYHPGSLCIFLFLCLFSCVPTIFIWQTFPLLADLFRSTYVSSFQFRSENRLFRDLQYKSAQEPLDCTPMNV